MYNFTNNVNIQKTMEGFNVYIDYFDKYEPNHEILQKIISKHATVVKLMQEMGGRYEEDETFSPILGRTPPNFNYADAQRVAADAMINNKLNNAYPKDIVDTKIGYYLGLPINYTVDQTRGNLERLAEEIENFRVRDNIPDKDSTLGKRAAIYGYGARLVYLHNEAGRPVPRIANVNPQECIFFYRETMSEPSYAMRYYDAVKIDEAGDEVPVKYVEFYDDAYVHYYEWSQTGEDLDGYRLIESVFHGSVACPLFGLENNDELTSDFAVILKLVDAFNRTFSDASNEIEATRLAFLVLYNMGMSEDDIHAMRKNGVIESWGENAKAEYLTKNVNDSMIENHLNRLDQNIIRFAKSVNFNDKDFAGNISGIAIKFKTMALEHKAIIAENKMRSTLQHQMRVMCGMWSKLGVCSAEDYLKVWFGFKRNLPINYLEEAQTSALLQGRISEDTRLSLFTFVDDPNAEKKAMEKDNEVYKLDDIEPIGNTTIEE